MKVLVNSSDKVYLTTGNKVLGSKKKCGAYISDLIGDIDANNKLNISTDRINFDFSGIEDIGDCALAYKFTGISSSYRSNLSPDVSFPDLVDVSGNYALSYAFRYSTISTVSFPELVTVSGSQALEYAFQGNNLTSISLPKLTTVSGNNALQYCFSNNALTEVSFPELTTVSGTSVFNRCFTGNNTLQTARLPKLTTVSGASALQYMFYSSTALTDVYFNALTTTSFGSTNVFSNMMQQTSNKVIHTLHFPSNMQSTISGLSGYPLFGGTSGYVQLAFDLPATS